MRASRRSTPRRTGALAILAAAVAVSACAPTIRGLCTNPRKRACDPDLTIHSVSVDPQGRAVRVDRVSPGTTLSDAAYRAQVAAMLAPIREGGHRRVLVRIHGGLNELGSALRTSGRMTQRMLADTATAGYPIFVNWESGIRSAYLEHATTLTQGRRHPTVFRQTVGTVAYVAADVGRAVTRAPVVWFVQARNFFAGDRSNSRRPEEPEPATAATEAPLLRDAAARRSDAARTDTGRADRRRAAGDSLGALRTAAPAGQASLDVWKGDYRRSALEAAAYYGTSVPLFPLKMFGTFVVDAGGTPGWANMRRRVQTMFHTPAEFDDDVEPSGGMAGVLAALDRRPGDYRPATGAVSVLFDALEALADSNPALRVTLVGHSMGAIVAAEVVRAHPRIRFDNIVFLAAASSARDFDVSVAPYLAAHPETQFYSLSLHPLAELRERTVGGVGPNGSLLEWIDAYLAAPEAESDRTMGKYTNVVRAAHMIPPEIRDQVRIKAFGYRDGSGCGEKRKKPFHHGHFNDDDVPFWNPAFWQAGVACPGVPARSAAPVAHRTW
jgi:pimeloyl-ACP methyl ester carboxylesterase